MTAHRDNLTRLLGLQHAARRLDLARLGLRAVQGSSGSMPRLRGRGMTFEEHRAYAAGDEPRFIDWRVTARTGDMHIKVFREEHERPVVLLADLRPGMFFGTRRQFKSTLAADVCALIGWTAAHSRERLGGTVLNHGVHEFPARSGRQGLLGWINGAAQALDTGHVLSVRQPGIESAQAPTLSIAATHLRRTLKPGSVVVIASDFSDLDATCDLPLNEIARHNQLVLVPISDPIETDPPAAGRLPFRQSEYTRWVDFGDANTRQRWESHFADRAARVKDLALRTRALRIPLTTAQSAEEQLGPWIGRRR